MLIFVEGKDDKDFIESYLEYLQPNNMIDEFSIQISGGKDKIQSIKEIEKHDRIKIIFDADNDFEKAKKNIEDRITKTFQNNTLKKCEIFLFPNNDKENKGRGQTLEYLLNNIIRTEEKYQHVLNCLSSYEQCIKSLLDNNEDITPLQLKAKVHAYKLAFGFDKKKRFKLSDIFDFDHEYLKPLKDFLEK